MSFHTPAKPLKPKEMKLEEGVVKGAVIVDENMAEWNPAVGSIMSSSTYTTINKNTEVLADIVKRTADSLKLPETEEYALLFEDPKHFVSDATLPELVQGFLLIMTAAPRYYASKLKENLSDLTDISIVESALLRLSTMTTDPVFVKSFYENSSIGQLYDLIEIEAVKSSSRLLHLLLLSISNSLDCDIHDVGWKTVSAPVIHALAVHIIGQAKSEDSNTVLIVLQMMEKLVTCDSLPTRNHVFSEVQPHSLIRHLEKSDERVNRAALSLLNSFHSNGDSSMRSEIVDLLDSVPFRSAVRGSVLRDGRVRDGALLDQLIPLQRLLLNKCRDETKMDLVEEQVNQLTNVPIFSEYSISPESALDQVRASGLGQFGLSQLLGYLIINAEDVRILLSENSMRVNGDGWELVSMCLQCLSMVAELLGIIPSESECVDQLLEFLFTVDNPVENLFALTIQLYQRTWREMQATRNEAEKVGKVARQQIRKAIIQFVPSVAGLDEALTALPYWKMQDIWKKEQAEKENNQLSSQTVSSLRKKLLPSIEGLVRQNRKNFIKQGHTFKKVHKGKSKDLYVYWKLDATEKYVVMISTDVDQFVDGVSSELKSRKVNIKDIKSAQLGDDGATLRKGGSLLRTMKLELVDHDQLAVSSSSDNALCAWIDALNDLIGKKALSQEARKDVDRLLNLELRLRLVAVPQPKAEVDVPPLPTDFSWITLHSE